MQFVVYKGETRVEGDRNRRLPKKMMRNGRKEEDEDAERTDGL